MPSDSVHCVVTSPPYYGLRSYLPDGDPQKHLEIGLEETPQAYVERMVEVFREVRRVLRRDGTCWLNLGDSYNAYNGNRGGTQSLSGNVEEALPKLPTGYGLADKALKPKDRMMIPHRVAIALQADGWWVRDEIIWHKPSPMPLSVRDRTTTAHEPIFLLSKAARYFYDADAIAEPGTGQTPGNVRPVRCANVPGFEVRGNLHEIDAADTRNARSVWKGLRYEIEDAESLLAMMNAGVGEGSLWRIAPEPYAEAHFATFPSELPRRCIAAGTSDRGCCPACGAPWRRITEREAKKRSRPNDLTKRAGENGTGNHCANTVAGVSVRTLGWEPSCGCDAGDPVGCVVLDPFSGSGTTGAVAVRMGRRYVGCELNPEYARLSETRIGRAWKGAAYRDESKVEAAPLFANVAALCGEGDGA